MKKTLLAVLTVAFVCAMATNANAVMNHNAKLALHYAGGHDAKANTCDFVMSDCSTEMVTSVMGSGRYDIYALAIDVNAIAGVRYGLECEIAFGDSFFFYGWTTCSDLEIPTVAPYVEWPDCGAGNAQTWVIEQGPGNVTLGILDVYVYPGTNGKMCMAKDPRVGFAEFCDGSQPSPECNKVVEQKAFGCVGFNRLGYNPCGKVPVDNTSWGAVKSLYR